MKLLWICMCMLFLFGCTAKLNEEPRTSTQLEKSEGVQKANTDMLLDLKADNECMQKIEKLIGSKQLQKILSHYFIKLYPYLAQEKEHEGFEKMVHVCEIVKFDKGYLVIADTIRIDQWSPSLFYIEDFQITKQANTNTMSLNYTYLNNKLIFWGFPSLNEQILGDESKVIETVRLYEDKEVYSDIKLTDHRWFIMPLDIDRFPTGVDFISEKGDVVDSILRFGNIIESSNIFKGYEFYKSNYFNQIRKLDAAEIVLKNENKNIQEIELVKIKQLDEQEDTSSVIMKLNSYGTKEEIFDIPEFTCWRSEGYDVEHYFDAGKKLAIEIPFKTSNIVSFRLLQLNKYNDHAEKEIKIAVDKAGKFITKKLENNNAYCYILVIESNGIYYRYSYTFIHV